MQCFRHNEDPEEVKSNKYKNVAADQIKSPEQLIHVCGDASVAVNIGISKNYKRKKYIRQPRCLASQGVKLSRSKLDRLHSAQNKDNIASQC